MFLIELIVGIFVVIWSLGGCVRCIERYQCDGVDDYSLLRLVGCHLLEGPLSWLIGLIIIIYVSVTLIEGLFEKKLN